MTKKSCRIKLITMIPLALSETPEVQALEALGRALMFWTK